MTYVPIGTVQNTPAVGATSVFPPAPGRRDRGYFFQLEQLEPASSTENTYWIVVAVLQSDDGPVELPLIGKFFPKGRRFAFAVAIPPGQEFNPTSITIEVTPKNRFRAATDKDEINLTLYQDDDEQSRDVVIPYQ